MIISKTPFRISLFGGGSDFPSYYKNNKASVVFSGITTEKNELNELELKVYKDEALYESKFIKIENRKFEFSYIINAGLFEYRFELYDDKKNEKKLDIIR